MFVSVLCCSQQLTHNVQHQITDGGAALGDRLVWDTSLGPSVNELPAAVVTVCWRSDGLT